MIRIRKLIWASWFIGTGLIVLSYLRLVDRDIGILGTVGWLLSQTTSKQP